MNQTLTQGQIETMILRLADELERETYAYADLSDAAAKAEADYKLIHATTTLRLVNYPGKMTVMEKQANIDASCSDHFRTWKIAEARRQSCKELLISIRARLDAQRSLAANVRAQT